MDFLALGPLRAVRSGVNVVPRAAKPRTLLALLGAYSGHIVPIEVIVSELWENDPPRTATTTLHTYVMQLRRLIARASADACGSTGPDDSKQVLRLEQTGYLLDRDGGSLDVEDYDRLAADGFAALTEGDFATARARFVEAEGLWRGEAFADVRTGPRLSAESTRLQESRRLVRERRIEADLQLGRHHEVLGELAGLTADQPANEKLRRHYVIALYRCGYRIRALSECDQLRRRLGDEFGLDLSPSMSALRQAILIDDAALERNISYEEALRAQNAWSRYSHRRTELPTTASYVPPAPRAPESPDLSRNILGDCRR
ncbi:BTAD domain-containing putative transcriptional regulator [Actinosynnema sp. NPDC051121]